MMTFATFICDNSSPNVYVLDFALFFCSLHAAHFHIWRTILTLSTLLLDGGWQH